MSALVHAEIETIVGAQRHPTEHYGRAVMAEQTVYVLHSQQCKDTTPDLRDCPYSVALDQGIEDAFPWTAWARVQGQPARLEIRRGYLVPDLTAGCGQP
jgi:hypothetical protein